MAEHRELPGWPKKRLVREVRSHLSSYSIRPKGERWRLAWQWAHDIAISYYHTTWPRPAEIASLYILLLLCNMADNWTLGLPYRASEKMPEVVATLITDSDWHERLDPANRQRKRKAKKAV
ncbi:hypothetical protein [Rubinisphaera brasiliensis]|uniref:Uncharacterized protein n=1 Tax=Rubinisphaera brasiliensis (strain ATCC 49424 / DSM 5305 / JCM 21570 / IAM 15109 / NBRC 103401 / IFAM 1448) TaxID=756272 RepID=F0SLN8_RUBBR|nr:hypothetical protein [Rubinisphaera brasiliensis]ADY58779.1 hypothetical protein Plabr_1163 [Rubinisphaera brasiliensis DSM 5305]